MDRKKYIIGIIGAVALIALAVILFQIFSGTSQEEEGPNAQRGVEGDPVDITHDFYSLWSAMKESGGTSTTTKNPLDSMALSLEMQEQLRDFDFSSADSPDPVLCQGSVPTKFRTKVIFETEEKVEILVLSSNENENGQAAVTLEKFSDRWAITNITCSTGEQAPQTGEFSFDNSGFLLKDSLPEGFNKEHWYVVYEQDGLAGHTAPLIIGAESVCVDAQNNEASCSSEAFTEATPVHVQGTMTEAGVDVRRIEFGVAQ